MYNKYIQAYLHIILQSRKDNYYQQLLRTKNNYNQLLYTQEQAKKLSETLFSYNNPKKEKMTLWFLIKGVIRLPQDQYKIDQAFNLVEKQHLNFQEFTTPQEIINRIDKSTLKINEKYIFNPDTQSTFSNKKVLKNGIVIYNVQDSKQGQLAIRKIVDINWGYDANPWCLAARPEDYIKNNKEKLQNSTQQQKYQILYGDQILKNAWNCWSNIYNAYPKRIAFQNGKLLAFCANDDKEIKWWDRNNYSTSNIPGLFDEDDPEYNNFQYNAYKLARNPNTSPEILSQLVNINDFGCKQAIALNPNTPPKILIQLANSKRQYIRQDVAKNPNTPPEILQKLAYDTFSIKQYVATNPNTPIKTLNRLANDENTQRYVVLNPNVSPEILSQLANSKSKYIRSNVAENPNSPSEILSKLVNDEYQIIKRYIAANPNTPLEILNQLSNNTDDYVRWGIAKNPNAPLNILIQLANDPNYNIRWEIAKKQNIPIEILKKLANDNYGCVKFDAKKTLKKLNK